MSNQEVEKEIFDVLRSCSEQYRVGPTDASLKDYARRLAKYNTHPKELFLALWEIPKTFREFPTQSELEREIKMRLGIDKPHEHPITQELIDRHYQAQLKEGVPEAEAMKGKLFMEELLNKKNINKKEENADPLLDFDFSF